MPDEELTTQTVLRRAERTLRQATDAAAELQGIPSADVVPLHHVAVFGRSVSLVIQNLRTQHRDAFDDWYAPWATEMRDDELFQWFNKLRNQVLKEGGAPGEGATHLEVDVQVTENIEGGKDFDVRHVSVTPPNPPRSHLGRTLIERSTPVLCSLYVDYLTRLYLAAKEWVEALERGLNAT